MRVSLHFNGLFRGSVGRYFVRRLGGDAPRTIEGEVCCGDSNGAISFPRKRPYAMTFFARPKEIPQRHSVLHYKSRRCAAALNGVAGKPASASLRRCVSYLADSTLSSCKTCTDDGIGIRRPKRRLAIMSDGFRFCGKALPPDIKW